MRFTRVISPNENLNTLPNQDIIQTEMFSDILSLYFYGRIVAVK
jgi:hypothetical protein